MVTSVTRRRVASALLAIAFATPAVALGGAAWADPSPAADPALPTSDPTSTDGAPAAEPIIGSWITGGTLLEGTKSAPATKPVAKPAAQPVTATVPAATTRTSTRTGIRSTVRHTHAVRTSTPPAAATPDGATALPFTGGHVDALMPAGVALLVGGIALTIATRPRRTALRSA